MPLSPYEATKLIGMYGGNSIENTAIRIGYSDGRALRRVIARDGGIAMKPVYEIALQNMAHELLDMPWGAEWRHPLADVHALREARDISAIERQYAAKVSMIELFVNGGVNCDESDLRRQYLGALYFLGQYHLSFAFHPRGQDNRIAHIEKSERAFSCLLQEFDEANPIEQVFSNKCVGNMVALRWNTTAHEERTTPEMEAFIEEIGFFDRMANHIEKFPKLDTAPFAALAVASAFNKSERFQFFYNALIQANSKFENYDEFDSDFDNFVSWSNSNMASAV